jgi:iron complex outermembrane recepter protein
MTITLTQKEDSQLWAEAVHNTLQNPEPDEFLCQIPKQLGKGYNRDIEVHPHLCSAVTGCSAKRSRGVELDIAGEILPGWKIIATYAYTDAEITKDNQYQVGNLLNNVAPHSASIWTTYEIQRGSLQGLGFGLGLYYVGDRQGDLANSFVLPSYFRTDAALYYKRNYWKAAINIKNLFDEKYYETSTARTSIYPGAPLTVLGTISVEF